MKKLLYIALGYLTCEAIKTETGQKTVNYLKNKGGGLINSAKKRLNEVISEEEDPASPPAPEEQVTE
jgi:hypothetical protein